MFFTRDYTRLAERGEVEALASRALSTWRFVLRKDALGALASVQSPDAEAALAGVLRRIIEVTEGERCRDNLVAFADVLGLRAAPFLRAALDRTRAYSGVVSDKQQPFGQPLHHALLAALVRTGDVAAVRDLLDKDTEHWLTQLRRSSYAAPHDEALERLRKGSSAGAVGDALKRELTQHPELFTDALLDALSSCEDRSTGTAKPFAQYSDPEVGGMLYRVELRTLREYAARERQRRREVRNDSHDGP